MLSEADVENFKVLWAGIEPNTPLVVGDGRFGKRGV